MNLFDKVEQILYLVDDIKGPRIERVKIYFPKKMFSEVLQNIKEKKEMPLPQGISAPSDEDNPYDVDFIESDFFGFEVLYEEVSD